MGIANFPGPRSHDFKNCKAYAVTFARRRPLRTTERVG